jgi:deoxycytidylate deaminase
MWNMVGISVNDFLSNVGNHMFKYAVGAAMCSPGVGQGHFKHGAILVKNNVVLSAGFNQYKTHPKLTEKTEWPYLHAETHAMFKYGLENLEDTKLYVVRIRPNNLIGISKPCETCQYFICKTGVKEVHYTTNKGYKIWNI